MGQKVNPIGFRLAINKDWRSKWFASGKDFSDKLHEDLRIRKHISGRLQFAALSKVVIERAWNSVRVTLHTSRPGLVIGRKGAEIEKMTGDISKLCGGSQVKIDIIEIRKPELDAQHVAEQIAIQLERRIAFRRAMKRAVQTAMEFGAEGIRVRCGGRLGGADIARAEWYREGKVPLQTLRVPIDYGTAEANTVYGIIGVKVWINKKPDSDKGARPQGHDHPRRRRNDGGNNNNRGGDNRGGNRGGSAAPAAADAGKAENAAPAAPAAEAPKKD